MRKKLTRLLFIVLALVALPQLAMAKLYGNARFGYFIEIPEAFTVADPEPENGDGQEFHPADKSADLIVSGGWIIEDNFAAEGAQYKVLMVQDGWRLTYENKSSKASAVYSAQKGDRIFYARMITSCGGKAHADYRLEYPIADKAKYDATIKSLNATQKAGKGSCG